jgi:hypothetical protein
MQRRRKPSKQAVAAAWKEFHSTPEGRIAIGALMGYCGVYAQVQASDPVQAGIEIGKRNVAAWISDLIVQKPETYIDERVDLEKAFDYEV